jgi:hypothetical protein
VREKIEEAVAKLGAASRSFSARAASQAGVDVKELLDPNGEAAASLVDVEMSPGAASLALPIDLITFESWVLGHLGDRDELELDVNTHREVWFGLGAWLGETLRTRHGGFWLIPSDDPTTWRVGFSKILLEIAPHAFAEKLLRAGQGLGKRVVSEVERIREMHEEQAGADGGKPRDRYNPQHYARLHSVPLAQWLVLDMGRLGHAWGRMPAKELVAAIADAAKRMPPQNAAVVEKILEALGELEEDKPAAEQEPERGLFEAVAQVTAMKRGTAPIAVDVMEKYVLPALYIGIPEKFPPLGGDDVGAIGRGVDLFSVYVEVCPYAHPAADGGLLGFFASDDLGTPYPDRQNLDVSKGDWVIVNPARLRPLLERFDPKRMLSTFDRFVEYVSKLESTPRVREVGRDVAETASRVLADMKSLFGVLDKQSALVFRLLPPP